VVCGRSLIAATEYIIATWNMEFLCGSEEERSARYISGRRLGEGAFGEVRLATDSFTGQKVAQKSVRITNRDEDAIPRAVFRELESLRQLSGSGYVTSLLDYYTKETSLVLVLEYLPSDLQEVISQAKEFLPSRHIKSFSKMILEAVGFCHSRNIIHRDIKPSSKKQVNSFISRSVMMDRVNVSTLCIITD
jgi:serine/threonine protein kinase